MKAILICFSLVATVLLFACQPKDNTPTALLNENQDTTAVGMAVLQGTFVSGAHTTSGTVRIHNQNRNKTLLFENFKTDNGPDLRVYLSKDKSAKEFRELGKLKSINGNFNYDIPADLDTSHYPFVLIWCEDFSVLFGSAELKNAM